MHTPPQITGYMVVRDTSHQNRCTAFPYRGSDRDPWWGLAIPYYEGGLSEEMTNMLKPIFEHTNLSGLEICTKFSDLAQLDLEHTCPGGEIIGLWSPVLNCVREPDIFPSAGFLGFEVRAVGEFSLILSGQHSGAPELAQTLSSLNRAGLFDRLETAREYAREYQRVSNTGAVEKSGPDYEIISIYHISKC